MSKPVYNFNGENDNNHTIDETITEAIDGLNKEILNKVNEIAYRVEGYSIEDLRTLAGLKMEQTSNVVPNRLLCSTKYKSEKLEETLKPLGIMISYGSIIPENQFMFVYSDEHRAPLEFGYTKGEVDLTAPPTAWSLQFEIKVKDPYLVIIGELKS